MLKNPEQTKNKIVQWIRDYFAENGPTCSAVIGISGGKDSSVAAALCAEALGKDRVVGVLMPRGVQPDISDSQLLVDTLQIPYVVVNIGDAADALEKTLESNEKLQEICGRTEMAREAKINMPPRIRMATLYAVAQNLPNGGRVVNTCNASEDYVGYSTKYGDAAGDFSPLGNLTVREVLAIGDELGLPEHLVHKAPDDGMCGKTDEDNLGFTYEQLDDYILGTAAVDVETVAKIERLHKATRHKYQPMPTFSPDDFCALPGQMRIDF
jgi:NAD+ synthase